MVQAVGKDAAGRWQYLYHDAHVARRERQKQRRLIRFIEALPRMRRAVAHDLALPGISRSKVLAGILEILRQCFLRPGSKVYADENGSYGIATLRDRHVSVKGDVVRFDFKGKSRRRQQHEIRNRRLARLIRELKRHPGKVFKYRAEDGSIVGIRRKHINAYIKEVMGESFSAKDFRTWAANVMCLRALNRTAVAETDPKKIVAAAIRETAEQLGNTPAVCRASYVFSAVLEVPSPARAPSGNGKRSRPRVKGRANDLSSLERSLLRLLRT